jgi:hypothetical protein
LRATFSAAGVGAENGDLGSDVVYVRHSDR